MRLTLVVLGVAGCLGPGSEGTSPVELSFTPDPGAPGEERYLCFGFDAAPLGGADLGGIALVASAHPVSLHHVTLYAGMEPFPDGPIDCVAMPATAVPLNVWAPGGADLVLDPTLAVAMPDGTTRLIVQAHALRNDDGPAAEARLVLSPRRGALHRAAWLPVRAPTPALRPHHREEAEATCVVDGELQLISTWPHMHLAGAEFHGAVTRAGTTTPIVDIVPWVFDAQRTYPIDVGLAPGDAILTRCVWQNITDTTILPGPRIIDEMCGQSLIAWPAEAARCR